MNPKKIFALLLAAVLVMSLAACGAKEPTAVAPEATNKDTVIIAIGDEPSTLDPTQGWGHGNAPIIQSTLVRYTADMTFANDLATEIGRAHV